MPVLIGRRDFGEWLSGNDPGELLHPADKDALQEWTAAPRVNRSGVGDDDPTMIEPVEEAKRTPLSRRSLPQTPAMI
jgi:hypothetical protein